MLVQNLQHRFQQVDHLQRGSEAFQVARLLLVDLVLNLRQGQGGHVALQRFTVAGRECHGLQLSQVGNMWHFGLCCYCPTFAMRGVGSVLQTFIISSSGWYILYANLFIFVNVHFVVLRRGLRWLAGQHYAWVEVVSTYFNKVFVDRVCSFSRSTGLHSSSNNAAINLIK